MGDPAAGWKGAAYGVQAEKPLQPLPPSLHSPAEVTLADVSTPGGSYEDGEGRATKLRSSQ